MSDRTGEIDVLRLRDGFREAMAALLARYGMALVTVGPGTAIPGSFWGEEEAGLAGDDLYARADTPLHSMLHEACHYVCMDAARRSGLHTDAGGDDAEECAVCYLQILLADEVPGLGRERLFDDMDAWGYSFRLGSTQAWFEQDAQDARDWLVSRGLVTREEVPTWKLNTQ